jgi:hypothetical protein
MKVIPDWTYLMKVIPDWAYLMKVIPDWAYLMKVIPDWAQRIWWRLFQTERIWWRLFQTERIWWRLFQTERIWWRLFQTERIWWRLFQKRVVRSKLEEIIRYLPCYLSTPVHVCTLQQVFNKCCFFFARDRLLRERPFNLKGGSYGFFPKKYSDSQCCWKKYSDFGGGKKK